MNAQPKASILHADLDAFYASVEQRDNPALQGRPVIVGMGVVLASSYEAKRLGVRTAMGAGQARRLCPDAVVVEPRMHAYSEASRAVFEAFANTSPLVEGLSIDEAFLDVSGLGRVSGTPRQIARQLRADVSGQVGLNLTIGVARTKFLAKVASGVAKPDGLLVVEPNEEIAFLHPLPVGRLWGVGPITQNKLNHRGISTVGEVAALDERVLISMLGRGPGLHLYALAHNRDPRRVETGRRRSSIGAQRALGRSPRSSDTIEAVLTGLVDRVVRRLRSSHRIGRTVTLRFRFDDFGRATRSRSLAQPTSSTQPILDTARGLLAEAAALTNERGLTMIGVSVGNLDDDTHVQLALPFTGRDLGALDSAIDAVSSRFGSEALGRAALVRQGSGMTVPMLPD